MSKVKVKKKLLRNSRSSIPSYLPDLNRSQLARELGVDRAHISRIFSGKVTPGLPLMRKLAKAMGVSLDKMDKIISTIMLENEVKNNAVK